MATFQDELIIETELFEHREVGPHFINDCCFGEDFAAWLRPKLSGLADHGYTIEEAIQEDYGWGFWIRRGGDSFWVALSYAGEGPTEETPEWHVIVSHDAGLNLLKRLFHKPDPTAFVTVRDCVFAAVKSADGIKVVDQ